MYLNNRELAARLEEALGEQEWRESFVPLSAIKGARDVAIKHDTEKNRLDLVPVSLIESVGKVLSQGAARYGDRNWENGLDWNRPYGAAMRHLTAWWGGESLDSDSGMSHLHHAACEIAFLIEYEARGTGKDNRPHVARDHSRRIDSDCGTGGVDGPDGHV